MNNCKEYRFKDNPKEKEFFDKFQDLFFRNNFSLRTLDAVIFGWNSDSNPNDYLNDREVAICTNLIQWLGSPVGQGFLRNCGFELNKDEHNKN
jgi:hypothetical protein